MEAVVFVGIQATGKSTFFKDRFFATHVRINLDMLRTRHREAQFLDVCLETQQRFVVDNTNPTAADRARYIGPAKNVGFRVVGYYFQSKIEEAIERNATRTGKRRIPDAGIRATHAKLEIPKLSEGFDELYYVRIDPSGAFEAEEWRDEV